MIIIYLKVFKISIFRNIVNAALRKAACNHDTYSHQILAPSGGYFSNLHACMLIVSRNILDRFLSTKFS